jgi:DNA polymerase elongation subunit (family B)
MYYTNVAKWGNTILYRGVENGKRVMRKDTSFEPTLFTKTMNNSPYRSMNGDNLEPRTFSNMREANDFVEEFSSVENFGVFGMDNMVFQYIVDKFEGGISQWSREDLIVYNIDIEVDDSQNFPYPDKADHFVTSIALECRDHFFVWGCKEYKTDREDVTYIRCRDEVHLLRSFLEFWKADYPDVVTGWNNEFFDMPYLINRMNKVLGDGVGRQMSPWNFLIEKKKEIFGKTNQYYDIVGVAILDYMIMYRKFAFTTPENYKLNTIAQLELGDTKISYDENQGLTGLYNADYQKFIDYNIQDVNIIRRLDAKLKLIDLIFALGYQAMVNYADVFNQTRMWDNLIYARLKKDDVIIPPKRDHRSEAYEGGYVKEPIPAYYKNVASFDLDSLYPHLIMQYNLGPDTIISRVPREVVEYFDEIDFNPDVDNILAQNYDLSILKKHDLTVAPNGCLFDISKRSFLAEMMDEMYAERKKFKKLMLKNQQLKIDATDDAERDKYMALESRYNLLQMGMKVTLNSAYGAMGSKYFRYYDIRVASAITKTGQLSIRWIEKGFNKFLNNALKNEVEKDYVIAIDTDSNYLWLDDFVQKYFGDKDRTIKDEIAFMDRLCEKKIEPYIEQEYGRLAEYVNAYEQKMSMGREVLADGALWTAKKHYIMNVHDSEGTVYEIPKIKVQGMESIKSDTPGICRKALHETYRILLNGEEDELHTHFNTFEEQYMNSDVEDVALPKGVNKLEDYHCPYKVYKKGALAHAKAALYHNKTIKEKNLHYRKIESGDKIKYVYLKQPNTLKCVTIGFDGFLPREFGVHEDVDYDTMFHKSFVNPATKVANLRGWSLEPTSTLDFL